MPSGLDCKDGPHARASVFVVDEALQSIVTQAKVTPNYEEIVSGGQSLPAGYVHDGIYRHLLAILARTAAIDNEKRRCSLQCDQ
jgi:hypothetical protein